MDTLSWINFLAGQPVEKKFEKHGNVSTWELARSAIFGFISDGFSSSYVLLFDKVCFE